MKYRMRISLPAALLIAPMTTLTACASKPPELPVVIVGNDDIKVAGTTVRTADELVKYLMEQKIDRVRLQIEAGVGYERIGRVIYTVNRSGARIEKIDVAGLD